MKYHSRFEYGKSLQANFINPRLYIGQRPSGGLPSTGASQGASSMLKRLFTEHPATVGETYGEHFLAASGFASRMFVASLACFVHALLPFLCVKTGSRAISELHERMVAHRNRGRRLPAGIAATR
jgi:hypothetical protein